MFRKLCIILISVVSICAMLGTVLPQISAIPVYAQNCGGLFFSEYVEGSSNNKALEIFNGYGVAVDLSHYEIRIYFNGSSVSGNTISLSGSVASGDVFVVADDDAVLGMTPDQTATGNWFNGDDAVELAQVLDKNDDPVDWTIDVIGQIGVDPGSYWGTASDNTANHTLRRKASVTTGDSDGSDVFDPALEWDFFAQDTFGGLGTHTANCTPTAVTLSSLSAHAAAPWAGIALAGLLLGALVLVRRKR